MLPSVLAVHLMHLVAVISLSVAFGVLPSRRERLCFTTWMSVLKPRAMPPTLSQIHQKSQSGLLQNRCKPACVAVVPTAITDRLLIARHAMLCIAEIGDSLMPPADSGFACRIRPVVFRNC